MAIKNKEEIKIYYELNNENPKAVAKHFGIKYRTLMVWIKNEKWQRGKHIQNIEPEIIRNDMLKKQHFSIQSAMSAKIENQMRASLGAEANSINEIILKNMLEKSTDELLLNALGINFIQKNIALAAILAKNELLNLVRLKPDDKAEPLIIASAEKVSKIFADMKEVIYGKEVLNSSTNNKELDLSKLSNAELDALIAAANED